MKGNPLFAAVALIAASGACRSASDDDPGYSWTAPGTHVGSPTDPVLQTSTTTSVTPAPSPDQPVFGEAVSQADPPPPISGGTLAVAPDGNTIVASDPDRDRIYVVDLANRTVLHDVALPTHAEPGRVAIDDRGTAYVALRRKGGIGVVNLATGALSFIDACRSPRGVAFDPKTHLVHVACADGDLLSLSRTTPAIARLKLESDLRDVVVLDDGDLLVTQFRSANFFYVTPMGTVERSTPATPRSLAWRAIHSPIPHGSSGTARSVAVVAQDPDATLPVTPSGWGGTPSPACGSGQRWTTEVSVPGAGSVWLPTAVLPVDVASTASEFVVIAAGNAFNPRFSQVYSLSALSLVASQKCSGATEGNVPGQAIAAAFAKQDTLVVQTREPAALHIMTDDRKRPWKSISLSTVSRFDTGHAIFHANSGNAVACASCHAEGGDDGHVWQFVVQPGDGIRRTPSLRGTLKGTAPYHWTGDITDVRMLADTVFVTGMGGPPIAAPHIEALQKWLFAIPAPTPFREADASTATGKALFDARCKTCHSGEQFTDSYTVDVGTGGLFQVPSLLGIAWRAPFLHNGCAATLRDRFADPLCGGTSHASADLTSSQIDDLVRYLETL
jgi:mono/diheme cytochrome c family protein